MNVYVDLTRRLMRYMSAAQGWVDIWADVSKETQGMNLQDAHEHLCARAEGVLPYGVEGTEP